VLRISVDGRKELLERERERAKTGDDPGAERGGLGFHVGSHEHLLRLGDLGQAVLSVLDVSEVNDTITDPHALLE
jgi:hypothetical protein